MKKFLLPLMFALAILFPLTAQVEAADVPDFRSVKPSSIILDWDDDGNYRTEAREFGYKCKVRGATGNFIKSYAETLMRSGYFRFDTGYRVTNPQGVTFDRYCFFYTGSKKITDPVFVNGKNYAVSIDHDITGDYVFICVAGGLSYGKEDNSSTPVRNSPVQTTPVAANQAVTADVPDFAESGAYYKKNQLNGDGSTLYIYGASSLGADLNNDYVGKYIRLLTSKYKFVQAGYEKKKWGSKRLQQNRPTEFWRFRYTGSKNVWDLSSGCHLEIKRIRELDKGIVSFEIKVAHGLTMAGNHGSPKPSSSGGDTFCSYCSGSGKCTSCGGTGYYEYTIDYQKPCEVCNTTGKCVYCNGTGKE